MDDMRDFDVILETTKYNSFFGKLQREKVKTIQLL